MEQLETLHIANAIHQKKICNLMIVDDEMMVTASLQAMLGMAMEHDIFCYNNPIEALNAIDTVKPDLVISDFSMPEMDGISFLKAVKQKLPEVTLILLTGYADKESAIEAINHVGLYRYIQKPWNNDELKLSINNGLERSYLISHLRQTVNELNVAQAALSQTNQQLENLVEQKTRDLQATYRKLQAIVQNTTDGILTLNAALEITSANPAIYNWLHQALDKGSLNELNTQMRQYAGTTTPETCLTSCAIEQLLHTSQNVNKENRIKTFLKQKKTEPFYEVFLGTFPMEMSIAPLSVNNPADQPYCVDEQPSGDLSKTAQDGHGYVLVLRDIQSRKEIERLREDFVSTLTHDLRTPLLAAIQTLGFFSDGTLGQLTTRQHELIAMLISSNRELLGLVNVLLEVYKYESGQYKLILEQLDLYPLIQHITQELRALASSRKQVLTLLEPVIPKSETAVSGLVLGDKQELKRVFTNLIGNAIHYTPQTGEGQIEVTLEYQADRWIKICVSDNGRGIPEKDLSALFQRFSQGTSRQRSSGSGLGLFLSRQIVEAHHGHIMVESQEGVGSCFTVLFPVSEAPSPFSAIA